MGEVIAKASKVPLVEGRVWQAENLNVSNGETDVKIESRYGSMRRKRTDKDGGKTNKKQQQRVPDTFGSRTSEKHCKD
ncbi:hypothetical protein OIDMADRAFT_21691 [Oidiodendron maius Zn]|uniref:Uncharacterized protein n=1 Tax=Oidiodendron maius (strain Zn) TaxID=913774 RepID=A0A0C3CSG0_OIDMZ|nr:hypothetical protein OIDMADRAFT_21691 [Oidiodendron maius Zn]